ARTISEKRILAQGHIEAAARIEFKGKQSHSGVIRADGIGVKGPVAHRGVLAAGGILGKRPSANCRVTSAGGIVRKSVIPYGRVITAITNFWANSPGLRPWRQAGENDGDGEDPGTARPRWIKAQASDQWNDSIQLLFSFHDSCLVA